ncbi:hypothetical protein T492DRAFT_634591 [Pavlovales sp. CCMP2436]|nr:hypothetical protein T492DRAFT_634591 [Pavlovales sp. CCMP2436]
MRSHASWVGAMLADREVHRRATKNDMAACSEDERAECLKLLLAIDDAVIGILNKSLDLIARRESLARWAETDAWDPEDRILLGVQPKGGTKSVYEGVPVVGLDCSLTSRSLGKCSGERPFPCDEAGCLYRAAKVGSLNKHKRTHTGERPHACDEPGCKFRAAHAGDLNKRTHTGERPFPCDEPGCNFRATQASKLTEHKRAHSGERPHACDETGCEYSANTAGDLKKHKRTHSGERPYACDEAGCEYSANQASDLTRHKRTHSV